VNGTAKRADQRTDLELLTAARDGDRPALAEYAKRVLPGLADSTRAYLRTLGRPDWTEDILQEVILKVMDIIRRSGIAGRAVPDLHPSWHRRTARNIAVDWRRKERIKSQLKKAQEDQMVDPGECLLEQRFAREQARAFVAAFLGRLPDQYAELFRLRYVDGLSRSKAAKRLGLSMDAAYKREQRGKEHLRRILRADPQLARRILGPADC
jgi:RNA polymerase sigma factor (sigma-70 family)